MNNRSIGMLAINSLYGILGTNMTPYSNGRIYDDVLYAKIIADYNRMIIKKQRKIKLKELFEDELK